jgi:hypothetical protein
VIGRGRQGIGAPLAVGLADLGGLTAAAMRAVSWTQLLASVAQAQQPEAAGS